MEAKSLLLAAALITLPAATAFAQASTGQSAAMPPSSSTSSSMPSPAPSASTSDTTQSTTTGQSTTAGTGQTGTAGSATPAVPATLADLKVGSMVYDSTGAKVGSIESATSTGAVVSTGTARAQIPLASFGKNSQGLVIGMTKAQLEAAVAKAASTKP